MGDHERYKEIVKDVVEELRKTFLDAFLDRVYVRVDAPQDVMDYLDAHKTCACTDGYTIYFNSKQAGEMAKEELGDCVLSYNDVLHIITHELMHTVMQHQKGGSRYKDKRARLMAEEIQANSLDVHNLIDDKRRGCPVYQTGITWENQMNRLHAGREIIGDMSRLYKALKDANDKQEQARPDGGGDANDEQEQTKQKIKKAMDKEQMEEELKAKAGFKPDAEFQARDGETLVEMLSRVNKQYLQKRLREKMANLVGVFSGNSTMRRVDTYSRVSRKVRSDGIITRGRKRCIDSSPKAMVLVDLSGSMSSIGIDKTLARAMEILRHIKFDKEHTKVMVYSHHLLYESTLADVLRVGIKNCGGGGTDVNWLRNENLKDVQAIVNISDGLVRVNRDVIHYQGRWIDLLITEDNITRYSKADLLQFGCFDGKGRELIDISKEMKELK